MLCAVLERSRSRTQPAVLESLQAVNEMPESLEEAVDQACG